MAGKLQDKSRETFRILRQLKRGPLFIFILVILFSLPSHAATIREVRQNTERVKSIEPPFQFAVLGDSRDGDSVYGQLIQKILERKPHFIIHTGDMVRIPDAKKWNTFFDLCKPIDIPFFPVVGNHDVGYVPKAEEMYRKQFSLPEGKPYYAFQTGEVLFVILDSEKGKGKILDDQWAWLEDQLSSFDKKFKLVFIHRPLFLPIDSFKQGKAMDRYIPERDRLHQLFLKKGVMAVFAGDDHRYDRREKDKILYVITGGAGAPLSALKDRGGYYHYVWVSVHKEKMEGEVMDLEGRATDRFMIE